MSDVYFLHLTLIDFGHTNILKYCDRPFEVVEEMDNKLIAWWQNSISEADTVYFLGDFAFASEARIRELLEQLTGTILIVPGNHDKKLVKTLKREAIKGVELLPPIHEIKLAGNKIILCHFPLEEWDQSLHLHGHVHGTSPRTGERRYDVGWDASHDFVSEEQVLRWVAHERSD